MAPLPGSPAKDVRPRGCLATLGVLVVMLSIVGGGFVAASAVADLPAERITVATGVDVLPLPGWEFGGRSDSGSGVLLSSGAGSLFVHVIPGDRGPREALLLLRDEWQAQPGTQITTSEPELTEMRPGQATARFSYTGTFEGVGYPVEGDATAVQGTERTVLFDGWAGVGDYALVRPDVDRMIVEATIP